MDSLSSIHSSSVDTVPTFIHKEMKEGSRNHDNNDKDNENKDNDNDNHKDNDNSKVSEREIRDVGMGSHFTYRGGLDRGKFHDDMGEYTFKDGSRFVGKMVDGRFHGPGQHYFKNGLFQGVWEKGRVVSGDYVYDDDLVYNDDKNWEYCDGRNDRRYVHEHVHGIGLAGKLHLTGQEEEMVLPEGCYDAGDGYLDLEKGKIFDYHTGNEVREPDEIEREFIKTKSRAEASIFL